MNSIRSPMPLARAISRAVWTTSAGSMAYTFRAPRRQASRAIIPAPVPMSRTTEPGRTARSRAADRVRMDAYTAAICP
jgi:hypothetical protein